MAQQPDASHAPVAATAAPSAAIAGPAGAPSVASIMTRDVVTIQMDDSIRAVRSLFATHKFHHLIVLDRGRAVGVISDRDLLKRISPFVGTTTERPQDTASLNLRVHRIMTRELVSCAGTTSIQEAGELMLARGVSCLPVLDGEGRCQGIVTLRDFLRRAVRGASGGDAAEPGAGLAA